MEEHIINNTYLRTQVVQLSEFSSWGSFSHNEIHKSAQVQNFRKKPLSFLYSGLRT